MSTTILKTPLFSEARLSRSKCYTSPLKARSFDSVSFLNRLPNRNLQFPNLKFFTGVVSGVEKLHSRLGHFEVFASGNGDSTEAQTQTETQVREVTETDAKEEVDSTIGVEDAPVNGESVDIDGPESLIIGYLNQYREAITNNESSKAAEIEALLRSFEEEKVNLEQKVATLTEEFSYERDRVLRISADFDNFRKRTERERLSLVSNAQGEVVEKLLSVLDNFERAKAQIKLGSEAEEKISNSYQSIYKQFVEILDSLGVASVESVGKPFDPMLHEAIMREESTDFEEGIIIEEYRKGFQVGDRLLRPSMVKVSSGPGPSKPSAEEEESKAADSVEENGDRDSVEP